MFALLHLLVRIPYGAHTGNLRGHLSPCFLNEGPTASTGPRLPADTGRGGQSCPWPPGAIVLIRVGSGVCGRMTAWKETQEGW